MTETEVKLDKLKNELRLKYLLKKISKQGFQENLEEVYKPLITPLVESQSITKDSVINRINAEANITNRRWMEFLTKYVNSPRVVEAVGEIKTILDAKTASVLGEITKGNRNVEEDLHALAQQIVELNKMMQELSAQPSAVAALEGRKTPDVEDMQILTDLSQSVSESGVGESLAESATARSETNAKTETSTKHLGQAEEYVRKWRDSGEQILHEKSDAEAVVEKLYHMGFASDKEVEGFKKEIKNPDVQKHLLKYVEYNPNTNLSSRPWVRIRAYDTKLYNEIKSKRDHAKDTDRTGSGFNKVEFLPDDSRDLEKELARLLGSYSSGNDSVEVFNEINAVVDELRRKGRLSIEDSKRIYKSVIKK